MTEAAHSRFPRRAVWLCALAWAIPTSGHFFLGKWARGLLYVAILGIALTVGLELEGNLYQVVPGQPLTVLATLGAMGMGMPYFLLRFGFGYHGGPEAPGFEYATVFLLSVGLMNLLLVLDVWDLASGRKE